LVLDFEIWSQMRGTRLRMNRANGKA
jgi:hypothetical protein